MGYGVRAASDTSSRAAARRGARPPRENAAVLEGIVVTVVGGLVLWLTPLAWKRLAPMLPWARFRIRQAHRLWYFRRGRFVPALTISELEVLVKDPGVDALHPLVRERIQQYGQRRYLERQREPWIRRRADWFRRWHSH